MSLLKSDFWYDLPEELIAQHPIERRDMSRMLVIDKHTGRYTDRHFCDVTEYIKPGDCLVLNDTRVFPARIYGVNAKSGGAMEFLLLNPRGDDVWEVLAKPGRRAVAGKKFTFGDGCLEAEVTDVLDNGNRVVKFSYSGDDFMALLNKIGQMPLPHYIHEQLSDPERYQTVYSREVGSVAAPTAGLHFTDDILKKLADSGVKIAYLTLHVGVGTFRPVTENDVTKHHMHTEYYHLPQSAADIINKTKQGGGRVFCVGTTSCRTLESVYKKCGKVCADEGSTDIFIYPPFKFGVIDCLITNFHLPESTLIMLVAALCGRENILNAYKHAVTERYRFFSFGDCCLITDTEESKNGI